MAARIYSPSHHFVQIDYHNPFIMVVDEIYPTERRGLEPFDIVIKGEA
jgi:hypothetical protein